MTKPMILISTPDIDPRTGGLALDFTSDGSGNVTANSYNTVNVLDLMSYIKADGSDDSIALQKALNAATPGTLVKFPAGKTIGVTTTITYPGGIIIDGQGATLQPISAMTTPVLVAAGWYNNSTTCDNPVRIWRLNINGNNVMSGSGAHGLVTMNYWSTVDDCLIQNVSGDGMQHTAHTANGTHITNTCVEMKIRRMQIRSVGGNGINVYDSGSPLNSCTDGFIEDCIISGVGIRAINVDMAPGWFCSGNHLYGTGTDDIYLNKCYATRCIGNYVDGFGAGSATFINGINMSCLDGRGSDCIGNHIGFESGAATGPYTGIHIVGAGSNPAVCTVIGNTIKGGSQSGSIGISIQTNVSQQSFSWTVYLQSNDIMTVASKFFIDSYVTPGDVTVASHIAQTGSAPTAAAGANAGTSPPAPAVNANAGDSGGNITFGTGTSPAAGAQCVVTLNKAFAHFVFVSITPTNSATAALQPYVSFNSSSAFTVSCVNAPAASQANTVYGFNYQVIGHQ